MVLIPAVVIPIKGANFGTEPMSFEPLTWSALVGWSLPIALLFCFVSFVGFEATAIHSEEAKDPKRTVPRGTFFSVILIGVVCALVTLTMVNGAGVANIPGYIADLGDPTTFILALSDGYIGRWYTVIMRVLFITSVFLTGVLPSLLLVAAVVGVIAAHLLKQRNPQLHAAMGRHRE